MVFKPLSNPDDLKALGSGNSGFDPEKAEPADARFLESFPNPMAQVAGAPMIQFGGYEDPKEFTSLCPKTGQPDFARIVLEYVPDKKCLESKSWKLYLGSFRNAQEFHEACVALILRDVVKELDPYWVRVTGQFTPRGGISINPEMVYDRELELRRAEMSMPEPT
jgi:7-cyano-7-deazaguanine reductase